LLKERFGCFLLESNPAEDVTTDSLALLPLNSVAEGLSEVFEKLGLFQIFQVSGTEAARSVSVIPC
jgi:hypothetical protein